MKKNNDTLSNIPKPIEATTLQRAFFYICNLSQNFPYNPVDKPVHSHYN